MRIIHQLQALGWHQNTLDLARSKRKALSTELLICAGKNAS
jgi:hypothetical protein